MTLRDDLAARVMSIVGDAWTVTAGRVVPEVEALPFGNVGKQFDACFMYADLSDSTGMVNRVSPTRAAAYYKAFLHCASKLIKAEGGTIEAFDGDRVMGIFLGAGKEAAAVRAALKLVDAMQEILEPAFAAANPDHRVLQFTVGIDSGPVLASKTGVREDADLVWVGSAANYAAKLNSFAGLDHDFKVRITERVKQALPRNLLVFATGGDAWQGPYTDTGTPHYRTTGSLSV